MAIYKRVKTRKSFIFLTKKDALKNKKSISKWAENVKIKKNKDKDYGYLYKLRYTYYPFKKVKK